MTPGTSDIVGREEMGKMGIQFLYSYEEPVALQLMLDPG